MRKHIHKQRKIFRYVLLGLVIIAIFGWYQYSRYQYLISTPVDETDTRNISFQIKKGESLATVATKLQEKDVILDKDAFSWYTKLNSVDRNIVAGRFILQRSFTIPEVVEAITNTEKSELVLTIPEGSTVQDIDEALVKLGVIESGEFLNATESFNQYNEYTFLDEEALSTLPHPLEGYLFPDTYFIDPIDFYSENLIQLMLTTFEDRIADEINTQSERTPHEIVTMASIVEKEVRTTADIPIVAGILWKRLDNDWMLGADATLLYLKEDRTIDYQDLQEDSPYNTRINAGLPPGPISNPGLESLMATIHPEDSDYWFYLTTLDTGEVIYAVSNEQHNANKVEYLY